MRINPIYQFDTINDTGIDQVPVNAKVMVLDDGTGKSSEFVKKAMGSFTGMSTISDFLSDESSENQTISSFGDLVGVDITTVAPVTNDYLKFNGTEWVAGSPEVVVMDDLGDIDTSTVAPVADQILKFDGTNWVPGTATTTPGSLDDVTDVDLTTVAPTDGQSLVYDLAGTKWVPGTISTASISLNDITDVDLTTVAPTSTQLLRFDGTNWVPSDETVGGASELEKITENANTGYRLLSSDPLNYGDIGQDAIDFSISEEASSTNGATGLYSFASGQATTASGVGSFASGSHCITTSTTSVALGYYAQSTGQYSMASGYSTTASGKSSHAEGHDTTASGNYGSHAEGHSGTASGYSSHAEGYSTEASGNYGSHAEGSYTTASGFTSHAEGYKATASGENSHAEGYYTTASNPNSHAAGRCNIGTATDTIHETGIGADDDNRKNAFEIYTDGRLVAPELTTTLINSARSLVTKEYADALGGGATVANDLTDVDTTTVAPVSGDVLKFDGTNWVPGSDIDTTVSLTENAFTATASQTAFVISAVVFGANSCEVYTNGIRERRANYAVSDDGTDTTVTFSVARAENDLVDVIVY